MEEKLDFHPLEGKLNNNNNNYNNYNNNIYIIYYSWNLNIIIVNILKMNLFYQ